MQDGKVSTSVMIGEKGIVNLPGNFDKMSERRQKNLIVGILIEYNSEIAGDVELDSKESLEQRQLSAVIKNSKEGRRLEALRRARQERKNRKEQLLIERNGVLKVAKRMGLEMTEELKKLKEINQ
jgi:hypothetical protein